MTSDNSQKAAERRQRKQLQKAVWKAAGQGALLFAVIGFFSGIGLCIWFQLPIPPIAITECSAIFGAILGAFCGSMRQTSLGRQTLNGIGLGLLAAAPLMLVAPGLMKLAVAATALLTGLYLGYQRGALPDRPLQHWQFIRR